jgi:hypothetical protein
MWVTLGKAVREQHDWYLQKVVEGEEDNGIDTVVVVERNIDSHKDDIGNKGNEKEQVDKTGVVDKQEDEKCEKVGIVHYGSL